LKATQTNLAAAALTGKDSLCAFQGRETALVSRVVAGAVVALFGSRGVPVRIGLGQGGNEGRVEVADLLRRVLVCQEQSGRPVLALVFVWGIVAVLPAGVLAVEGVVGQRPDAVARGHAGGVLLCTLVQRVDGVVFIVVVLVEAHPLEGLVDVRDNLSAVVVAWRDADSVRVVWNSLHRAGPIKWPVDRAGRGAGDIGHGDFDRATPFSCPKSLFFWPKK